MPGSGRQLPDINIELHLIVQDFSILKDNFAFYLTTMLVCVLTGAEIRSVCTEAGMYAIRARRKMATEKDFLEAVNKVIKAYAKFSSTPKYMTYN